jgi:hypothetical protein
VAKAEALDHRRRQAENGASAVTGLFVEGRIKPRVCIGVGNVDQRACFGNCSGDANPERNANFIDLELLRGFAP